MATFEELMAIQTELEPPQAGAQQTSASIEELMAIQQEIDTPREQGSLTSGQFESEFGDVPDILGLVEPQQPKEPSTLGENIIGAGEAALTVGTGITGGTIGALVGTLDGVIQEVKSGEFGSSEAAKRIGDRAAELMQMLTVAPKTEAGQDITKSIGEFGEGLAPLAGLGGQISQLGKAASVSAKGVAPIVRGQAAAAGRVAAPTIQSGKGLAVDIFKHQSPTKQRIAKLISEGSTDLETARFELASPASATEQTTRLQRALNVGGARVRGDAQAIEAIKQGFDEGVIAPVKVASKADSKAMLKMVEIMEKGKKNRLFAQDHRPSDIAGNTLMERFRTIRSANASAGKEIGNIAKTLKGQPVNLKNAVDGFADSLDNLGISLIDDGAGGFKPDFKLSQLSPGDRGPIKEIVRQMSLKGRGEIDGFTAHSMKRIIDNNVTFGKVKTGLSGEGERVLKSFRKDIDKALDSTFPKYDKANTVYAETIGALDTFQRVMGGKVNLLGENADKAVGTSLRGVMSNIKSRINLIDSIDEIEGVARKHGAGSKALIEGAGDGGNNLKVQILFADELDGVFGPVARTSLAGEVGKEITRGAQVAKGGLFDAAVELTAKGVEKARGINQEAAFKSIKELLKKGSE